MSLRILLGLCEHRWEPTGKMIRTSAIRVVDNKGWVVGYTDVRQCAKCGQTKGFKL